MTRTWISAMAIAALSACAGGESSIGTGGSNKDAGAGGDDGLGLVMFGSKTDPTTCEAAASAQSYLGCDFWPTVTFNAVWSVFDFAVVVANVGAEPANVTVGGQAGAIVTATVAPLDVATFPLPWVPALKGADSDTCGQTDGPTASVLAARAAYHLTSDRPVIVYQFNALEYRGSGGLPGKDWSSCPGLQNCTFDDGSVGPVGCFSFSNDASILLPATAMTGNYRVPTIDDTGGPAFIAVTGTQDGTSVTVALGKGAAVLSGGPIKAGTTGLTSFSLDAGDVVQIAANGTGDLSGTLVQADKPIQVIAGASCAAIPLDVAKGTTCDHLEESVQPAETLGRRYLVAAPSGPFGAPNPYKLRLVGNVDGTSLQYPAGAPAGAPATVGAGEVVDLGILTTDLEIQADHEIVVTIFLVSSVISNPDDFLKHGDPSQSQAVAVEQFRKTYVFLAPNDYDVSFIDTILPNGTVVKLDGEPLPGAPTPIGNSGFSVMRTRLGAGKAGAHTVSADVPVGVQVIGYGAFTSYQYPAGLDLARIAPPPPPLK